MRASLRRYLPKRSSTSARVLPSCASNHATARRAASGCGTSAACQPFTRRKAFHILLLKLRPCSHSAWSNRMSLPAGAESSNPMRTPSAPYWSMRARGSGELPSDLDILRPSLSRTMPVKYTLRKGMSPRYSYPAMIMRATQKKMMSGPVTRSAGGVVVVDFLVVRVQDAVEERQRPQPRREPRVEAVGVVLEQVELPQRGAF